MKDIFNRNIFLKRLYFNAGKSIMDSCYVYGKNHINYKILNVFYYKIINSSTGYNLHINDIYGAFFDILCKRIIMGQFCSNTVVTVLDPHFSTDVICSLYIPETGLSLCKIHHNAACKANNLYTQNIIQNPTQDILIAQEFFKKSYQHK